MSNPARTKLKLGLALPTAGEFATADNIGLVAEGAERIGLSTVWVFERMLSPTGQVSMMGQSLFMPDNYNHVYSPLESLVFAAARTSRIRLGTALIDVLFHNPADLGRRLATIDQLSNGRLVAGVGQGWMREEFEAAGVPMRRMGAGFVEFIEALRAVWGPDPVSYSGRFYSIAESMIGPKPVQPGGPPLIAGTIAPASIERATRMGMGYLPVFMGWEALEGGLAAFRGAAEAAGRDPASLPVVMRVNNSLTDKPVDERDPLSGSVEQVAEDVSRLDALGVDEVFWSMDYVPVEPEAQLELMGELAKVTGTGA
jgi:probable F420-dependent oxidoreductase